MSLIVDNTQVEEAKFIKLISVDHVARIKVITMVMTSDIPTLLLEVVI